MHATREGNLIRLQFPYDEEMVHRVKSLPYSEYDKATKTWSAAFSAETLDCLDRWHEQGVCDVTGDQLLSPGEPRPDGVHDGIILPGPNDTRPYMVWQAWRHGPEIPNLISSARRIGKTHRYSLPPAAGGVLVDLVAEGRLSDPQHLLSTRGDAVVSFNMDDGEFHVYGDPRVQTAMDKHFPGKDVIERVREHGVDVQFSDPFSEEVYAGELARDQDGLQPDGITAPLYEYQAKAVSGIVSRGGTGLFLSPGLGKTLIGIAAGQELLNRGDIDRVFITAPKAVREQWREEILRFTGTDAGNVVAVHGTKAQRTKLYEQARAAQWVLVHHDLLVREADEVLSLVDGRTLLIVDEAHKCANISSARGKFTQYKLRPAAGRAVIMTGTPVLNDVAEWYGVLGNMVAPGCLGEFLPFANRYMFPEQFGGFAGFRRLDELSTRSRPHFIRWTKAQVAQHLPPLQVHHSRLPVDREYRDALNKLHMDARDWLDQHFKVRAEDDDAENPADMTAVGLLRAACSSPRLLHMSQSESAQALVRTGLVPDVDGPKLDAVIRMGKTLQDAGERVVVFTFSRTMAELIAARCAEAGIRHVTYHGGTSSSERDEARELFVTRQQETASDDLRTNPTMFIATDAAAEGLNLGRECSTLINFDLPWTAGRLEQRSNRIHRVDGTHESYVVLNLTLPGTIEESLLRTIQQKATIQDALFAECQASKAVGRQLRIDSLLTDALASWSPQST